MKLFVPACGDRIILSKPWTFTLYMESRNLKFAHAHGLVSKEDTTRWGLYEDPPPGQRHSRVLKRAQLTLPKGTVLECDRVYIRTFNKAKVQNENDYDSLTWKVIKDGKPAKNQRFWAKLVDCLDVQFDPKGVSTYRDRVKLIKAIHDS